jgi:hypothetical protein
MQWSIIYNDLCSHPHNGSSKSFKRLKKSSCIYIWFFMYTLTFTWITMIYSHCLHHHTLITIMIIIDNFIYVTRSRCWANNLFLHCLVRNIWFSIWKPTQVFLNEPIFYVMHHHNIWLRELFFLLFRQTSYSTSTTIL